MIRHRLRVAGMATDTFRPDAVAEIYAQSGGIPRLIVTISERCLLGAYAVGKKYVDETLARAAAREVLGGIAPKPRGKAKVATAVVGGALFAAAALSVVALDPLDLGLVPQLSQSPTVVEIRRTIRSWPITAFGGASKTNATTKPPSPESKLQTLMRRPDLAGDLESGMAVLFAMWNVKPETSGGIGGCAGAENLGLKCYRRYGTWSTLRNINRPTLINLKNTEGRWVHGVVIALNGDAVILDFGGQAVLATTDEVTPYWSGEFLVLWKPPSLDWRNLHFGMRGADVAWIRKRLAEIQGGPAVTVDADTFDGGLKDRVIAFQRGRDLSGDGIVTPMTLIHLNTAAGVLDVPVLRNEP